MEPTWTSIGYWLLHAGLGGSLLMVVAPLGHAPRAATGPMSAPGRNRARGSPNRRRAVLASRLVALVGIGASAARDGYLGADADGRNSTDSAGTFSHSSGAATASRDTPADCRSGSRRDLGLAAAGTGERLRSRRGDLPLALAH